MAECGQGADCSPIGCGRYTRREWCDVSACLIFEICASCAGDGWERGRRFRDEWDYCYRQTERFYCETAEFERRGRIRVQRISCSFSQLASPGDGVGASILIRFARLVSHACLSKTWILFCFFRVCVSLLPSSLLSSASRFFPTRRRVTPFCVLPTVCYVFRQFVIYSFCLVYSFSFTLASHCRLARLKS